MDNIENEKPTNPLPQNICFPFPEGSWCIEILNKKIKFYEEIFSFINGIYSSLVNGIYSSDMNPAEIFSLCVLPPQQEDRCFWRHITLHLTLHEKRITLVFSRKCINTYFCFPRSFQVCNFSSYPSTHFLRNFQECWWRYSL